jgi:SAM-dependent methyltransferase
MCDFTKQDFLGFWGHTGYTETWDGYEKNWTNDIMNMVKTNIDPHSIVLEIGCGSGYWTHKIAPLCSTMYAIDLIPNPELPTHVIYIENEDQQFNCKSIRDESIDFVFSFGVFCHLSLSACELYLQDILRVLKPNGKALLMYGDEYGLQKHFKDPNLTCEAVGWKYNTYEDTMQMISKYPVTATKMLNYRDTLLLIQKI